MELVATPLANPFQPAQAAGSKPWFGPLRNRLRGLLRLWHLASLDAPTVAVVWAWAFARTAHLRLAAWPLELLGLVVWAVYVSDRLLDARAGQRSPAAHDLRERHHFHWRHRWVLGPLAVAAGVAAAAIVRRRVPAMALPQDSAVALATLAYFSGVHGRVKLPRAVTRLGAVFGSRECLVGALFTAGCVLPSWSADPVAWPLRVLLLPGAYFSALAWLNVRAITCWETGRRLGRTAWVLAGIGGVLAAGMLWTEPRTAALVAAGAGSAGLIGWLDPRADATEPVTLRAAVDFVLLTPMVLLVVR